MGIKFTNDATLEAYKWGCKLTMELNLCLFINFKPLRPEQNGGRFGDGIL